ncbi:hypothetical protein [Bradyrhizobium lablabi]|uniref:hypothetical protein n=1 Tax=Bradyrhizobium lablabi TaxID=722472 RepID=UPI001BA4ECC2|nr:hypothetical protein [Bradyrhizobium lablabi]MBR0698243.1 hypothetical protein [Bradyrhizobium lablabi]
MIWINGAKLLNHAHCRFVMSLLLARGDKVRTHESESGPKRRSTMFTQMSGIRGGQKSLVDLSLTGFDPKGT